MEKAFGAVVRERESIPGGQMPIEGCVQNQHQHLAAEVQRLTAVYGFANVEICELTTELNYCRGKRDEAIAERDAVLRRVRELEQRHADLQRKWELAAVRERDGELVRTV